MNLQSVFLLVGLLLLIAFAVVVLIRRRKQGKRNCGCCFGNCSDCTYRKTEGR